MTSPHFVTSSMKNVKNRLISLFNKKSLFLTKKYFFFESYLCRDCFEKQLFFLNVFLLFVCWWSFTPITLYLHLMMKTLHLFIISVICYKQRFNTFFSLYVKKSKFEGQNLRLSHPVEQIVRFDRKRHLLFEKIHRQVRSNILIHWRLVIFHCQFVIVEIC